MTTSDNQDIFDFDIDDLIDEFGDYESMLTDTFPVQQGGQGLTYEPFVFDLTSGRYTNEITNFSLVLGNDILGLSEVVPAYVKSNPRMQKAIRNTVYFFCYAHKLREGYQGEILLNWLSYATERWETVLLVLDSLGDVRGDDGCQTATHQDIKDHGVVIVKRARDMAVKEEVRQPIDVVSYSNLDRVPSMKWKDVSFEDKTVVDSYMDNEYGKHVREALSILIKFPTYHEWVAVGDGPGVVYEACKVLGKTCHSTDLSQAMIDAGKERGNKVRRCDAVEALHNTSCPVIVMYNSLSIHGLLGVIADEFPERKVIVVSAVDAYEGRGKYRRYTGTSRLYYRNIVMPVGIVLKKSGPRPCNYTDFWEPESVYCIDNDRAYNVALAFRRMAIPIKLSSYKEKYKEGLLSVFSPTRNDIYMFDNTIQSAHKNFFNMNTGYSGKVREIRDHNEVDCGVYCTRGTILDGKFLARDYAYTYYEFALGMEAIEKRDARVRKVYFSNVGAGVVISKMKVPSKNVKRRRSRKRRRKR